CAPKALPDSARSNGTTRTADRIMRVAPQRLPGTYHRAIRDAARTNPPRPLSPRGRAGRIRGLPLAVAAGAIVAVFACLGRLAPNQLVEIALLAAGGLFLIDECEIGFVEFLEELLPGDLFERRVLGVWRTGELDADN